MTDKANDIVHAFIGLFAKYAPLAAVQEFELEMRQRFGGQSLYIRHGPDGYVIRADSDSTKAKPRPRRTWE